ncbi:MAG TPA: hypothetical protein VGM63_25270 [Mucilaginibacter sp.]
MTTHKHKYSYLENGKAVCFHDPTNLDTQSTLGQTIYDFLKFQDGQPTTEMISLAESASLLNLLENGMVSETVGRQDQNLINRWADFGERLRNEFDIYQFMLLRLNN